MKNDIKTKNDPNEIELIILFILILFLLSSSILYIVKTIASTDNIATDPKDSKLPVTLILLQSLWDIEHPTVLNRNLNAIWVDGKKTEEKFKKIINEIKRDNSDIATIGSHNMFDFSISYYTKYNNKNIKVYCYPYKLSSSESPIITARENKDGLIDISEPLSKSEMEYFEYFCEGRAQYILNHHIQDRE